MENEKFCTGCGAPLDANDQFCSKCGTRVPGMNPEQVQQEKQMVKTAASKQLRYASYLMLIYSVPFLILGIYLMFEIDVLVDIVVNDPSFEQYANEYGVTREQVYMLFQTAGYTYIASSVCGLISAFLCIKRTMFWIAAIFCIGSIILGVAGFFALFMGLFAFWMIISGKLAFREYEEKLDAILDENIR